MAEYHKIHTCFKRDMEGTKKILLGEWTNPAFRYLQDDQWFWSEKVDGTNIRVYWDGIGAIFGGRTDNAQIPSGIINRLNQLFLTIGQKEKLREKFPEGGVCFYGEGYGAGVQKAGINYNAKDKDFVLFDIMINGLYLERDNVEDIAISLGLDVVPIMDMGTLNEAIESARKGFISTWGNFLAEGYVLRPLTELNDRRGNRIITKIKHVDFLGL
jgi:hypothetical protein